VNNNNNNNNNNTLCVLFFFQSFVVFLFFFAGLFLSRSVSPIKIFHKFACLLLTQKRSHLTHALQNLISPTEGTPAPPRCAYFCTLLISGKNYSSPRQRLTRRLIVSFSIRLSACDGCLSVVFIVLSFASSRNPKRRKDVCGRTMEDDEKDFGEQFCSLCGLYTNARFAFRQTDKQVYRTYSKRRNIT